MKELPSFENRESTIDNLIDQLAEREEMNAGDILSDIITFAPYEGNEASNPDYLDEVADRIGIPHEEMRGYALKKAKEQFGE
jgi:hypothetical protein